MTDPANDFFFGYGSLVNRATHAYPEAHPARVTGWRRVWRHTSRRELAFLSVEPVEGAEIEGLVAAVPGADWAALDLREAAYDRHPVPAAQIDHPVARPIAVQIYAVPPAPAPEDAGDTTAPAAPADRPLPILLSYLDVVVQGFLREFGADGVARFFATTSGWEAPVLDDRAAPRYPRAQILDPGEIRLVDGHLAALGVTRIAG
ncbi:gamma-glutamylcyclotransferase family protein [Acidimangrovimonas sediminis]|uniref:gamma-glutamylcyclotransferase family protein n=1 Tax=Acidimangrovimonas sediminis TaxID=2056283 RepID=UPI000C805AEC|nr:gamma-glutamylcyclotransferase family protein [Acidimangrovimonas sediminis]